MDNWRKIEYDITPRTFTHPLVQLWAQEIRDFRNALSSVKPSQKHHNYYRAIEYRKQRMCRFLADSYDEETIEEYYRGLDSS